MNKYKKQKFGFSLAETLIVFLLVSIMLAAFAPNMTKRNKKSTDPSCVAGVKTVEVVFQNPVTNQAYTIPDGVIGNTSIYLVGAGGAGAAAVGTNSGGGGGGGAFTACNTMLNGGSYTVTVGEGAVAAAGIASTFKNSDNSISYSANGGGAASGATAGAAGTSCGTVTNCTCYAGVAGSAGGAGIKGGDGGILNTTVFGTDIQSAKPKGGCWNTSASCNPHGTFGADFLRSGLSKLRFYAGFGGAGGGKDITGYGVGARGGNGVVILKYKVQCE